MRYVKVQLELLTDDPAADIRPADHLHRELPKDVQAAKGGNSLTAEELARFLAAAKEVCPQHFVLLRTGVTRGGIIATLSRRETFIPALSAGSTVGTHLELC